MIHLKSFRISVLKNNQFDLTDALDILSTTVSVKLLPLYNSYLKQIELLIPISARHWIEYFDITCNKNIISFIYSFKSSRFTAMVYQKSIGICGGRIKNHIDNDILVDKCIVNAANYFNNLSADLFISTNRSINDGIFNIDTVINIPYKRGLKI